MSLKIQSQRMIISGAGLAGTLLAIGLKKKGHEVLLFEKRTDLRLESLEAGKSINLILTAKGIKPLTELGLIDKALKITKPVYGRMIHDQAGELTYQAYGKDDSEKNYSIGRSEFNKFLLDEAESLGVQIYFDQPLVDVNPKEKSAIFGKEKFEYDLFFGADGAGSETRKIMHKLYDTKMETTPLGSRYKEMQMPASDIGNYVIDEKSLHIWPRGEHMLMALPNLDGSFTMTIYMPDAWFEDLNTQDKVTDYFEKYFKDSIPFMPNFVKEFLSVPAGFLGSLDTAPWVFEDSICLLGDAAHAIVPFFGQGMNCSLSDVQYLLTKMDELDSIKDVFADYNNHQKLNGDAIRDLSLENFVEMCSTVGKDEFIFRKKVESIIEKAFPDKYRSRYARVVYTLMSYHEAKAIGEKQSEILDELCAGLDKPEDVDLERAEKMVSRL